MYRTLQNITEFKVFYSDSVVRKMTFRRFELDTFIHIYFTFRVDHEISPVLKVYVSIVKWLLVAVPLDTSIITAGDTRNSYDKSWYRTVVPDKIST